MTGQSAATRDQLLDGGRRALDRRAWGDAFVQLSLADRAAPLGPGEVRALATAARLVGKVAESTDLLTRAHREFLEAGEPAAAARCAFWLGLELFSSGEAVRGGGWFARGRRLLDDAGLDCVERGYFLIPDGIRHIHEGDSAGAIASFGEAAAIATRFGDRDLTAFALMGQGRALLRGGEIGRGVAFLDEAMAAIAAGDVSVPAAGIVYCSVIDACHEIYDLRRAGEWTAALDEWCRSQPELVSFRGECLVRRAELLQLHGAWADALREAELAGAEWVKPQSAVGAAFYRLGELHRLRGAFPESEAAYRRASEEGRKPEPGLALLRLAQGQVGVALAAIRRLVGETSGRNRPPVLAAAVEIAVAGNDLDLARAAATELGEIAAVLGGPFLEAEAAQATGAVRLAEARPREALIPLRSAERAWRDLDAPYPAARVRVLVALACRALGDADAADMELEAARRVFERVGARPDLARLDQPARPVPERAAATGGLSPREVEVLGLVAAGKTNRSIAAALAISEKTVARHLSNIFTKLGLSSRAAATAWAYQHHLIDRPSG